MGCTPSNQSVVAAVSQVVLGRPPAVAFVVSAVVRAYNDDALTGDARLLNRFLDDSHCRIRIGERLELFRRTPAELMADRIWIGEMDEAEVRFVLRM